MMTEKGNCMISDTLCCVLSLSSKECGIILGVAIFIWSSKIDSGDYWGNWTMIENTTVLELVQTYIYVKDK